MPANLPPQYNKVEQEFRKATDPRERLEKLRELFRLLPKHKGTEKLQAELKQKISRAKDEVEGARTGAKKASVSHRVPREGAGQIVLVGAPNAGKSALLAALTNAHPEVAPYPFTTRSAQPGMAAWEDARFQLVDLPPITSDFLEPWLPSIIRSADAALLVVGLDSDDAADAAEAVLERLASVHTELVGELPFDAEDETIQHVKTMLVGTRIDLPDARGRGEVIEELFRDRFPVHFVSATQGTGMESLTRMAYDLLGVVRVYTKLPGKPADRSRPFTVSVGSTIEDLAREIHADLERTLKYARIWGTGVHEGQTVKRDHELHDGDLVELHT